MKTISVPSSLIRGLSTGASYFNFHLHTGLTVQHRKTVGIKDLPLFCHFSLLYD